MGGQVGSGCLFQPFGELRYLCSCPVHVERQLFSGGELQHAAAADGGVERQDGRIGLVESISTGVPPPGVGGAAGPGAAVLVSFGQERVGAEARHAVGEERLVRRAGRPVDRCLLACRRFDEREAELLGLGGGVAGDGGGGASHAG